MLGVLRVFGALLLGAALGLGVTGCCTDPVNGERYFCLGEISDAEEARMGEEYAPSFIAQSGGVYPDPALQAALSEIVIDRMAKRSQRPNLPWKFTVLNTTQINAFALPGGQLFVTRGLLAQLESEAQFAHLMGHEVGHVTHRHSVRGQGRSTLLAILLGTAAIVESSVSENPDDPLIATQVLGAAGQLTLLKFSRDQELQSDERGVDYAYMAGYDPREARKTFELFLELKRQSGGKESGIEALMSTHPLDSRRIRDIDDYIAKNIPGIANERTTLSSPKWQPLMASLRSAQGIYQDYEDAMVAMRDARGDAGARAAAKSAAAAGARALPTHATFHVGLGLVALEENDTRNARAAFDKALSLDPNLFDARYSRGVLHQKSGNAAAAAADLERAHDLHPVSPLPCYALGRLADDAGDNRTAARWYRATLERCAVGSELETRVKEHMTTVAGPAN